MLLETMLVGTLCAPDNTSRRTGSVETGVGFVTFMCGTEVTMCFGVLFCLRGKGLRLAVGLMHSCTTATEKNKRKCVAINAVGKCPPRTKSDRSE